MPIKIKKPRARVGCVLIKDVTASYQGKQVLGEARFQQPPVGLVIDACEPKDTDKQWIAWDERIKAGALVLIPRTQKYEFPLGDGTTLMSCHHSDIRVFYEEY